MTSASPSSGATGKRHSCSGSLCEHEKSRRWVLQCGAAPAAVQRWREVSSPTGLGSTCAVMSGVQGRYLQPVMAEAAQRTHWCACLLPVPQLAAQALPVVNMTLVQGPQAELQHWLQLQWQTPSRLQLLVAGTHLDAPSHFRCAPALELQTCHFQHCAPSRVSAKYDVKRHPGTAMQRSRTAAGWRVSACRYSTVRS